MAEEQLSPKEEVFCVVFARIKAKYAESSARTSAWKLCKRPAIQAKIAELYKSNISKN